MESTLNIILIILMILFLILGIKKIPEPISSWVRSSFGIIFIILCIPLLYYYSKSPIIGILSILVAFELIWHSFYSDYWYKTAKNWVLPSYGGYATTHENWKGHPYEFPYTLEQEMVKKMTNQQFNDTYDKASFKPALNNLHDAAPVNYTGIV